MSKCEDLNLNSGLAPKLLFTVSLRTWTGHMVAPTRENQGCFVFMAFLPSPQQEKGFLPPSDWGSMRNTGRAVTGGGKHLLSHLFLGSWPPFYSACLGSLCCLISAPSPLPQPLPFHGALRTWVLLPALLVVVQMDTEGTLASCGGQVVWACC